MDLEFFFYGYFNNNFFFLVFRANLKVANRSIQINLWPAEGYAIFVCKDRYGAAGVAIEDKCIGILRYQPQPQPSPPPHPLIKIFLDLGKFLFSFFFFLLGKLFYFLDEPPTLFYKARKVLTIFFKKKRVLDKLSERFSCWYPLISINTNGKYLEKCKNH